jgi:hypothetical protein
VGLDIVWPRYSSLTPGWFLFLSDLSWTAIMVYFFIAAMSSYRFVFYRKPTPYPQIFDALFASLQLCWVVTIVFWSVLSEIYFMQTTASDRFLAMFPHTFNLIFVVADLVLSCSPISVYGWIYPLMATFLYTLACVIARQIYGQWVI